MNHEKHKNIIEAIGLLAIVVSMILVAWELREVNVASKIAARDSITGGHLEFMSALIDVNVLPMALWKLESGNGELSEFDSYQIEIHHQRRWRHYERVYHMYQYGVLTNKEWRGFRAAIHSSVNDDSAFSRTSRTSWETNKAYLSEDFVGYVDALIERND